MAIGLGTERLNNEYNKILAESDPNTVMALSEEELKIFDVAIPKLLNTQYNARMVGMIYSLYAPHYLHALMYAKKQLGGMYEGNDMRSGILSKQLCFNMFYDDSDETPDQKTNWTLHSMPTANTWEPMIGYNTTYPSVIKNDEFGAMVISHIFNAKKDDGNANITKMQYHLNSKPRTVQYVEDAFENNANKTYLLNRPLTLLKNDKLFVEGLAEFSDMPVKIAQGGVVFATAKWFYGQKPTLGVV